MQYKIISGKYETGTMEQKQSYCQLFGEDDIEFKFDLYFHWYNLIHELGHCMVDINHVTMNKVDEELYVNKFAVAYWRAADGSNNLN